MIKWLIRLAVFPIVIVLVILEWCGMYIIQYSGILCRLIAGAIFILVIIGYVTVLGAREHLIKLSAVGFTIFLIPRIGESIVCGIALMRTALKSRI